MQANKKSLLYVLILCLSVYIMLTVLQIYYNAYIHLFLLFLCVLTANTINRDMKTVCLIGGITCGIFVLLTIFHSGNIMNQVGFFLHYLTWPIVLFYVIRYFTKEQIRDLLRLFIIIFIVGDILSLKVLFVDNEVSRILAGAIGEAKKNKYYAMGVGGYGYVYAMVFMLYPALYWLMNKPEKVDKILLIAFLIVNYIFIIFASYTIALVISILLTVVALLSKRQSKTILIVLGLVAGLFFLLYTPILNAGINFFHNLGLTWVEKRLSQLLAVEGSNDFSSLRRMELYAISWKSFLSQPLFGGGEIGGHSQILDTVANFGLMGFLLPIYFFVTSKKCARISLNKNTRFFYFFFFVFTLIDTCNVMQIPCVIFFICPLIFNTINKTYGLEDTI